MGRGRKKIYKTEEERKEAIKKRVRENYYLRKNNPNYEVKRKPRKGNTKLFEEWKQALQQRLDTEPLEDYVRLWITYQIREIDKELDG